MTEKKNFNEMEASKVIAYFKSDVNKGLNETERHSNLEKYGLNLLDEAEGESIFEKIKEQFEDISVRLLLVAAFVSLVISFAEGEEGLLKYLEPFVIFVILVANASIGVYQDYSAEKAIESLKKYQSEYSHILKDGILTKIESKFLVPGDIIICKTGEKVPADARICEILSLSFYVSQSCLNGESRPTQKTADITKGTTILQKKNIIFSGTLVTSGTVKAVVIGTGMNTELGEIQKDVKEAEEDTKDEKTPLEEKLDEFGNLLAKIIMFICLFVWIFNFNNFFDPIFGGALKGCIYYFKIAVALAVAAIPEGLPAVITTCLALGTRRMSKKKAIVRKLPKVETLGCTSVICSDKTGTLTRNEMVVKEVMVLNEEKILNTKVEGTSFNPKDGKIENNNFLNYQNFKKILVNIIFNNESEIEERDGMFKAVGNPTEASFVCLYKKLLKEAEINDIKTNNKKLMALEFSSKRKKMSVFLKNNKNDLQLLIKGGAEIILEESDNYMNNNGEVIKLNKDFKEKLKKEIEQSALKGYRVLGLSLKENTNIKEAELKLNNDLKDPDNYSKFESNSTLLGFISIQDPVRPEVPESLRKCKVAGINVFMITGDIKETAFAIGKELNMIPANSKLSEVCYTGEQILKMTDSEIKAVLKKALDNNNSLIFARTSAKHKRKLVKILRELDQIVAMTGDGVNDASALKQSHIGIAMGLNGDEVAKDASDLILADDNFATIVDAIEEGRSIFANMKAFIRYMISSNIGEVVSIFISVMLKIPDGFSSIQLLWVNLVTDGLPATALCFNPVEPDIMQKPPRSKSENIVNRWTFIRYLVIGIYVGFATVGIFIYWFVLYNWNNYGHNTISYWELRNWTNCPNFNNFNNDCSIFTEGKKKASTLSLTVLVVIEMLNALNAISENLSIFKMGVFSNFWLWQGILSSMVLHFMILYIPFLSILFGTTPLDINDWLLVLAFSLPVIVLDEILKYLSRIFQDTKIVSNDKKLN